MPGVAPDYKAATARLILTADAFAVAPELIPGWSEPDPLRAVVRATADLRREDGLILLLPADWNGPAPEALIETARRSRSTPQGVPDDKFAGSRAVTTSA